VNPAREYLPPVPEAEPYRADPRADAPFPTEGAAPPAVPVDPNLPPIRVGAQVEPPRDLQPQFYRQGEAPPAVIPARPPVTEDERAAQRYGRIAVGFGVASLLINPIISPIAIVMGVVAYRRGQHFLGRWAIGTGVAAAILGIVMAILIAAGVLPTFSEMLDDLRNR
jgi:hypothetical protein